MKILVAEDDPVIRRLLEVTLIGWSYEVQLAADGAAACRAADRGARCACTPVAA